MKKAQLCIPFSEEKKKKKKDFNIHFSQKVIKDKASQLCASPTSKP